MFKHKFYCSSPDYNAIKVKDAKRSRSCSVSEMRQSTIDRLQSNLEKAEKVSLKTLNLNMEN